MASDKRRLGIWGLTVIFYLPLLQSLAFGQGALANGDNVKGSIASRAEKDSWTFAANKGDDITVSVSEAGTNTAFVPLIQLTGPSGTNFGTNWGDLSAKIHITADATGTYKISVSRYDSAATVGNYILTMARSPATFMVPSGDQGGTLTDGQNSTGTILRGDLDQWSFTASQGNDVTVSVSEYGANTAFVPMIQVIGPNGTNYGSNWGDLSAKIHFQAQASGTYKIVISRFDNADGTGSYLLTMARSPAIPVVPTGDQGGPMNNGQNYTGSISRGDLDPWTFAATKGDDLTISVSEAGTNTAFVPMIQLVGPDGTSFGFNWGDLSAKLHITAPATGTYQAIVSRFDSADGTGNYLLTMARSPASFVVSSGDEGGSLGNGQNVVGSILRGDLDQWSFPANIGDDVTVSISESGTNTAFVPMIQVIGPDDADYGFNWGDLSAKIHFQARASGTYKVVASRFDSADGVGKYLLTLARSPATFFVPGGDQGGAMTDGQSYTGTILRGDLDQWSFNAEAGDDVRVSISEDGANTPFVPMIQLIGPDGTNYGNSWGDLSAQQHITAKTTGAYTVVVSRFDSADGVGSYFLTFTKSPGTFVVPSGDQGGAMNNGQNYSGSILRGDLDEWSFNANQGDDITVSVSEVGTNTSFVPMIQLLGPDGTDFGFNWGDLSAKMHITANETGSYKVVVSRFDGADGAGNYLLTMARSPATFVVSSGDQGGAMKVGQTYTGTILRGDLDQWTFTATAGNVVTVTAKETGSNTSFVPMIQIIGPNGTNYGSNWGDTTAQSRITAQTTGTYKVVVSRFDGADGTGQYSLNVAGASGGGGGVTSPLVKPEDQTSNRQEEEPAKQVEESGAPPASNR